MKGECLHHAAHVLVFVAVGGEKPRRALPGDAERVDLALARLLRGGGEIPDLQRLVLVGGALVLAGGADEGQKRLRVDVAL